MARFSNRFIPATPIKQFMLVDTCTWITACGKVPHIDGGSPRNSKIDTLSIRPEILRGRILAKMLEGELVVPQSVLDEIEQHANYLESTRSPANCEAAAWLKEIHTLLHPFLDKTKEKIPDAAEIERIETSVESLMQEITAGPQPLNKLDILARKLRDKKGVDTYSKVITHNRENFPRYQALMADKGKITEELASLRSQLQLQKLTQKEYTASKQKLEVKLSKLNSEIAVVTPRRWADLDLVEVARTLETPSSNVEILSNDADIATLVQFYKVPVTVDHYGPQTIMAGIGKPTKFEEFKENLKKVRRTASKVR